MEMVDAEGMHKFSPHTCKGAWEILQDLKEKIIWEENELILDVGCGPGDIAATVLNDVAPVTTKIIAADISTNMISFAKRHHSSTNIVFKKIDVTSTLGTSWVDCQFTKVFCFYVMHRIEDDRSAYENMYKLLKPGGTLLLTFPVKHDTEKIAPYLAKLSKYKDYTKALSQMKLNIMPQDNHFIHVTNLLENVGFNILLCKQRLFKHDITKDDFVELFCLITPASRILPEHLFQDLWKDVKNIVYSNNILEKTREAPIYNYSYTNIVVLAQRPL